MRMLILAVMIVAGSASGQTMFKCSNGGKIEYSDKACPSGDVIKQITPDGSMSPQERAAAIMRFNAERAQNEARDRADLARRAHGSLLPVAKGS